MINCFFIRTIKVRAIKYFYQATTFSLQGKIKNRSSS